MARGHAVGSDPGPDGAQAGCPLAPLGGLALGVSHRRGWGQCTGLAGRAGKQRGWAWGLPRHRQQQQAGAGKTQGGLGGVLAQAGVSFLCWASRGARGKRRERQLGEASHAVGGGRTSAQRWPPGTVTPAWGGARGARRRQRQPGGAAGEGCATNRVGARTGAADNFKANPGMESLGSIIVTTTKNSGGGESHQFGQLIYCTAGGLGSTLAIPA